MKNRSLFLFLLLTLKCTTLLAAGAADFNGVTIKKSFKDIKNHNPCLTQKFTADPGVMEYNGRVYVYGTNDGYLQDSAPADNDYGKIKQINVMSSDDLVNWLDHGTINVAGGAARWAGNSWAPTAAHKTINGKEKFFLYFANSANGIGVLSADSPTGPWTDPIGKALISRQTPNSNVEWLFDPAVFVDTDGTGYLYFGGGVPSGQNSNPKTIRAVKLGNDMTSIVGTPVLIDAPWVFEDSGIHKMGNTYYYSYCTNWAGGPYGNARIAYMTSNNPLGPFTYKGTCFNNPGDFFGTVGNNHHTIIPFNNQYYIFYHAEWLNKQSYGAQKGYRTTHVDVLPTTWNGLGNAKGTLTGVTQLKNFDPYKVNRFSNSAWQAGIQVNGLGDTTTSYNRGDWTGVSRADFSKGVSSISINAGSANGAVIKICVGDPSKEGVAYVSIPATGDNWKYTDVTADVKGLTGVQDIFFVASADVVLNTYQFK